MKLQNMYAFPIPITYGSLGNDSRELNSVLVEHVKADVAIKSEIRSGVGVQQTVTGMEHKYPGIQVLKKAMDVAANEMFRFTGVNAVADTGQYWGNYNPGNPSAFHMPHSHSMSGDTIFSGVYFPMGKDPDDDLPQLMSESNPKPGSLVMIDPVHFIKYSVAPPNTNRYPFFGLPISMEPQQGMFILFPSYLSHMVVPMTTTEERMSIAFAIKVT